MKTLRECGTLALYWQRPSIFKRFYELHAGNETIATLQWTGAFKRSARAETADGQWEFQPEGVFKTRTYIRDAATGTEIAVIKGSTGGDGELEFADGRRFRWDTTSFWTGKRSWSLGSGMALAHLSRSGKKIEIEEWALSQPELPLLLAFGFYILKLREEESTAAT